MVVFVLCLAVLGVSKPNRAGKTRTKSSISARGKALAQTRTKSSKIARTVKTRKKVVGYSVRKGDNDWKIAHRAGLTVKQLRHLNGAKQLSQLRPGQKVNVMKTIVVKSATKRPSVRRPKFAFAFSQKRGHRATKRSAPKYIAKRSTKTAKKRVAVASRSKASNTRVISPKYIAVATPAADRGTVDGILRQADTFRGVRYSYGAMSRSSTDCSGFTAQVFRANGYRIPRTSAEQSKIGNRIARPDLEAGDLVFFRTVRGTRVSHVGIYVGNDRFIHASSGGHRVMISGLSQPYYSARFVTARRIAAGRSIEKVVETAKIAEKTQQVPVDPEPQQSASDVVGN